MRQLQQFCLGIKSPFIEFSNEIEVLANNSVPLNITKDEQALMHQEGLRKLGTFIKPVDLRDSTTGFVKADLTKKIPNAAASTSSKVHYGGGGGGGSGNPGGGIIMAQRRRHPIQEEMDQKQIILLDEDTDENGLPTSLTDEDRKFIVPMALKNASPDPRTLMATQRLIATTRATTTTSTTTKRPTTPATPEFASNINDLKKHILYLQNRTKHDSNFQSKFVVFPSLQKERQKQGPTTVITTTTARPFRSIFQYSAPATPPTRKSAFPSGVKLPGGQPFGGYYRNDDEDDGGMSVFLSQAGINARDKITIVPQVLLLNDQTIKNDTNGGEVKQRNFDKSPAGMPQTVAVTTPTTPPETTTPMTSTTPRRPTKKPLCIRNPDSLKCIRQRKREEQQRQRHREQLLREQREYMRPHYEPYVQTLNNTKRFAVSIEIPDSFKIPYNESTDATTTISIRADEGELQVLSRSKRSHHKRRNIGGGLQGRRAGNNDKFAAKYGPSYFERDAIVTGGRDFVVSNSDQYGGMSSANSNTTSPTVPAYSEPIDLNPDNCYHVDGMTYGQKKQCVLHTSVMPAISRGARAAIQECQFQFKNRRWNCSTTEDNTVFGPMTGLGSPEMAFIHALAAAMVTSFIARACRDGQLASCGCSRGSRPKQLHDDWTWGGCGDNLEYAYKFATDFIDVREKETRRGTRGAGNPERKRGGGRFHQRRNQQMQAMQADDAAAAILATTGRTTSSIITTTTTTAPMPAITTNITESTASRSAAAATTTTKAATHSETIAGAAGATINEHINSDKENIQQQFQQQQHLNSNKNVSVDGYQSYNNKNNNAQAGNNTNKSTTTLTSSKDIATQTTKTPTAPTQKSASGRSSSSNNRQESNRDGNGSVDSSEEDAAGRIKPEDLLELQERIAKEILNSKLQGKEMLELQEKINREILNTKVFNVDAGGGGRRKRKRKNQRAVNGMANDQQADATVNGAGGDGAEGGGAAGGKGKNSIMAKARSLMNLHNNEAGRRAVIKKTRITCKCHGVSGSCSLITCWQQLSSIREIGDYLREKYEESTEVKLNKRGRLQVKDPQFKVPTAHDLVYLDESPDWCRNSRQLQWPGTHGRICNKTSAGLDGCGILCCGRGYNTKNIVVRERCNCKFHWCCQVKCDVCVKVLEEHTCK
ncbi:protein Wnt-5 [Anastrepha ludens]|uniref:protein Wnt-5 n=1 Tax=Anastrepha ludens TaxID=28586 RepID=UPI0023AFDDA2|nr:protein Wnt-5 [Anastrepha ludens]